MLIDGSAGNKDDCLDAYVLAATLRTDDHRWRPLREDHPETKAPRAMRRARKDLVAIRVQVVNHSGPISRWRSLEHSDCSASTTPSRWLSCADSPPRPKLRGSHRHAWSGDSDRSATAKSSPRRRCTGTSTARPPDSPSVEAQARGQITPGLVTTIETLTAEIIRIETQIRKHFDAHPDQKIFTSLPQPGNGQSGNPFGGDRGLPRAVPF